MSFDTDNWDSNSGFEDTGRSGGSAPLPGKGGWHWLQTLVALVIVGLLSMACAYLTRNVEERPVWMMGLIFMVPTAALMAATILVEKHTSAMTPSSSRKPQYILAITATVLTFVVAVICDLIYLMGFKQPVVPSMSVNTPYQTSERLLIITDPTASMAENGGWERASGISVSILDQCAPEWEAALVSGDDSIGFAALTGEHRERLLAKINQTPDRGKMYYQDAVTAALDMAEAAGSERPTRILLLTDGMHTWSSGEDTDLAPRCRQANVSVSCVVLGSGSVPQLEALVHATGGKMLSEAGATEILAGMQTTRYSSQVFPASVEEKLKLDLLRNREPSAIVICCIMLLLEGLSLGVCISLMLSVKGQFRFQYILSPLMGLLAFALLKYILDNNDIATTWWLKEGIAFSLLGIVLMARNRTRSASRAPAAYSNSAGASNDDWA